MATVTNKQNFDKLVKEIRSFASLQKAAKEASNAVNKQKTVLKNGFKGFLAENNFSAQTAIVVDGVGYKFCVADSERIDPREWHRLWQEGEITDDQYFDCISVGKGDAKKAIGDDQVQTISKIIPGTEADVRRDESPEGATGAAVEVLAPKSTVPSGMKRRPLQAPASQPVTQPVARRKLTLKTRA